MIIRHILRSLLVVAVLPALLHAQRGMMNGAGRGKMPGAPQRDPGVIAPRQVNAVNLLIEHRQELTLSDSQFARVIIIKRTLDSTNAPLLRKADSVQRLFRGLPLFSQPSRARRDSVAEGRAFVQEIAVAIHENNATFRDRAYELLNAQQLSRAQEVEAKAEKAIADEGRKPGTAP